MLSDMQDLQKTSWQPDQANSRPSIGKISLAEEERACRNISARVENAVMPQLSSVAAQCNRLFSQASVALGETLLPLGEQHISHLRNLNLLSHVTP